MLVTTPGVVGRMIDRETSGLGGLGDRRRGRFSSRPPCPGFGVEVRDPVEEPEESGPVRFPGRDSMLGCGVGVLGEFAVTAGSWSGAKEFEHGNMSAKLQASDPDGSKRDSR